MNRFTVFQTGIGNLQVIRSQRLEDARGFLSRLFCAEELAQVGWNKPIAQINHTLTRTKGTVRGMHFQYPPYTEIKLVVCLRGAVWDVALDLRAGSPTFLQWKAVELSAHNCCALLIPEGMAHGFQALTDDCELLYLHSVPHAAMAEGGFLATDPMLKIDWPLSITLLSERDKRHPNLTPEFKGLDLKP